MFFICPLVHSYSVITLDNWHLVTVILQGPKITKWVTVNVCFYSNLHQFFVSTQYVNFM